MEMKTITVTIPAQRNQSAKKSAARVKKNSFARRYVLYRISRLLWMLSAASFLFGVVVTLVPAIPPQAAILMVVGAASCWLACRVRPRTQGRK